MFAWCGIGANPMRLRVSNPNAHPEGIYLQFCGNDPEAWAGVGPGSPESRFDVLPAYIGPTTSLDGAQIQYAFLYRNPADQTKKAWIRWNVAGARAQLVNELTNDCLVFVKDRPGARPFKIVLMRKKEKKAQGKKKVSGADRILLEVRMDTSNMTEADISRGDNQIQNFMSFITHSTSKVVEVSCAFRALYTKLSRCM
jgi:hypothetical protein